MESACRTALAKGEVGIPVDIDPGDMCQSCKMAISQKKYAAEFVDKDGGVFKFDDIGCMFRFAKQRAL
jgi:copper chaperone NosL